MVALFFRVWIPRLDIHTVCAISLAVKWLIICVPGGVGTHQFAMITCFITLQSSIAHELELNKRVLIYGDLLND